MSHAPPWEKDHPFSEHADRQEYGEYQQVVGSKQGDAEGECSQANQSYETNVRS
jgi:hypothetical protein